MDQFPLSNQMDIIGLKSLAEVYVLSLYPGNIEKGIPKFETVCAVDEMASIKSPQS